MRGSSLENFPLTHRTDSSSQRFFFFFLFVQHLTLQILQMYAYSYKQLAANEYMTLDLCFTSVLQTNYKN